LLGQSIAIVLLGNKLDLENEREVSKEEGEELKLKLGVANSIFAEVSAKDGYDMIEEQLLLAMGMILERLSD